MKLQDYGYRNDFEDFRKKESLDGFEIGRVSVEHRERYLLVSEKGEYEAELLGNLRFSAKSKSDLPVVGDWVAFLEYDAGKALIHALLPRFSLLERQAIGKSGEKQIIAANIDYGLVVQAINRDFNLNRLERYLSLLFAAQIQPIIILTKIDLANEQTVQNYLNQIRSRIDRVEVIALSNETHEGIMTLEDRLLPGKTYCLLGSSGVGKSSLINSLSGEDRMRTGAISEAIDRGKHITSHRELLLLPKGAILIDNPGMREVGVVDNAKGLETTFETIYQLAAHCRYADCTHRTEEGCAVLNALEEGKIDKQTLANYYKMENESAHFAASLQERRTKDRHLGKIFREGKAFRKKHKY